MATIKQVARLADVSVATVSRVLNGVRVTEANRVAVMAAVTELDYRPNVFARSLATNRSGTVGVVVNEIASPFYGGIVQGIESVVERYGMHLIVSSSHADSERERVAIEFLRDQRCEALVLVAEALTDSELLTLAQHEIPLVIVGRYVDALAAQCIYLDNTLGGYLATRYLLDRGHRRIAHITANLSIKDARDRADGYRSALAEAGVPADESLIVAGDSTETGGQRSMRQLLDAGHELSAVFAGNDQTAAGALLVMRERGVLVPDDVSLVGYDDVHLANYLYPALTTVRQPFREMGRAAARLALPERSEGEVTMRFEPELVERSSVRMR
ncbi:MAG TPA: LacI family DNA-binding transcriptional regulator [Trueperaceae bacterium]|nr:LacI family DNA-binding transcriptional regulator [Trueperaceae bacterium]